MSQVRDVVSGYSRGLYSSWFYYKPDRLLFDAGEGLIDRLSKKVYAIQRVLLSHGHEDHISGMPGLVNLRNLGAGAREKPLTVYYPAHDRWVELLRDYLDQKQRRFLRYELTWEPIEPGDKIDLGHPKRPRYVEAFASNHRPRATALSYRVMEHRMALKPEYEALEQPQIVQLIRDKGKENVCEGRMHNIFTYSGDTTGLDPEMADHADVLLHEATYFEDDCPDKCFHCTFERALDIARQAQVKCLVLFHASGGFIEPVLRRKVKLLLAAQPAAFPVHLIWRNRFLSFGGESPDAG